MKERPILFKDEMVRAILDGRKTQTRRLIKPQPEVHDRNYTTVHYRGNSYGGPQDFMLKVLTDYGCPFGKPGDRLWVREAWVGAKIGGYDGREDGGQFWYRATDDGILDHETKWRPSIHMPRRASRITLEITDVRAQRLQDITEDDAIAEGATSKPNSWGFNLEYDGWNMNWPTAEPAEGWSYLSLMTPQLAFGNYINVLHGGENWNLKPTNLWDENPFVWALTFRVLEVRS